MEPLTRAFQETVQFLGSLIRPTARSLRENSGLAVLSVVLAFGLWIFVTDAENPTRTRVFAEDIPVEPINVPDSVAVVEPVPAIRVRVTVADEVFDQLTPGDFEATVDLAGYTVGKYEIDIDEIRVTSHRNNVRIETVIAAGSSEPDKIIIELAQLVSKEVPVVINIEGDPSSGFTMGELETREETVEVSGPQEFVDQVTQAAATISVEGRTSSVDQAVRLSPRNSRDLLVDGVDLDPNLTQVTIPIEQEKFTRPVAVSPVPTGNPADGYNVVSISVNPSVVTIRGDESVITGTASIPTKPIDVTGARAEIVKTVSLDLPSGVEVTGGNTVVTVTIKVEPATGVFSFTVPVTASGLGGDLAISGQLPSVVVKLSGPTPELRDLRVSQISASINLSGLEEATHRLVVNVTVPSGITVVSVTPPEIDVVLGPR